MVSLWASSPFYFKFHNLDIYIYIYTYNWNGKNKLNWTELNWTAYTCVWLHLSLHFCDLSVLICFINLLVAARNFASANFWNSDFPFALLKYRAIFPWNLARNIVWQWNFSPEILRNFTRNCARKFARAKNEIRWISFALLLHNTVWKSG